jgi:hypothetical protein
MHCFMHHSLQVHSQQTPPLPNAPAPQHLQLQGLPAAAAATYSGLLLLHALPGGLLRGALTSPPRQRQSSLLLTWHSF